MVEENVDEQRSWREIVHRGGHTVPDDTGGNVNFAEHLARYRFAQQFANGLRVLDAACGAGYGTALLAEAGARSVLGVDIDQSAISYANQRYGRKSGVAFVQCDLTEIPKLSQGPLELCVSFETIEHLQNPGQFLCDVRNALSPGARLLISTPNRYVYSPSNYDGRHSPDTFHKIEWTTNEFVSLLSRYFSVVSVYGQVFTSLREARLAWWRARLEGRFPKSPRTRIIYAIAGSRKHFPLAIPYRGLRSLVRVGGSLGKIHSEKGNHPSSSSSGERNQVRAYSSSEAPRYTICLCAKR